MQSGSDAWLVNGIKIFVHRFRDESVAPSGLTLLLLHGFLDAGSTWDLTASILAAAGHEILAPDFRGFGKSDRIGAGGYYHFPDYVADIAALVELVNPERLGVVGHSMGGTVAALYASAMAKTNRIEKLALLEGVGPPSMGADEGVHRLRAWLADLKRVDRTPKRLASMEEAVARLAANNPLVPHDALVTRAKLLTRIDADGKLSWSYDPLHRTTAPFPFRVEEFREHLAAIACPTLVVGGGPKGYHPADEEERFAAIQRLTRAELPNAGHMMHWTEPRGLASVLLDFFQSP